MLRVYHSFLPELTDSIYEIYRESLSKKLFGNNNNFIDGLYDCDCIFFFWMSREELVSCVRCEISGSQALLYSLETAPNHRGKGFGKSLVSSAVDYLIKQGITDIHTHIKKNNKISLSLHDSLGFEISKDSARLIDGTVSQKYYTLIYKP